jgi:hypothetical protein
MMELPKRHARDLGLSLGPWDLPVGKRRRAQVARKPADRSSERRPAHRDGDWQLGDAAGADAARG